MKRVFIVHCWGGNPNYCWYPQVKKDLEASGFEVFVPEMPDTDSPQLSQWLPTLKLAIQNPDQNTFLVGHSLGCITILHYLKSLTDDQKVGGVVLVAGFSENLDIPEIQNFFEKTVDLDKIKTKADHFIAIHSDNDPYVAQKHGDIFKEKLGAKLIIKHQMGHFSGPVDNEESCMDLPEVTQAVVSF